MRFSEMALQSAMEYLMTYGWAILAIAIVMVSLYSLGIFNSGNLQPTATPGSCEVVRTVAQTSLAGQCSNLIPKYVGKFDGSTSYVQVPWSDAIRNNITLSAWVSISDNTSIRMIVDIGLFEDGGFSLYSSSGYWDGGGLDCLSGFQGNVALPNQWHFLTFTYSNIGGSRKGTLYVDGNKVNNGNCTEAYYYTGYGFLRIGTQTKALQRYFAGQISNVQIYNSTLDNATVKALYQEGIGGAPIRLQNLMGWWPLNGNANDYSGNNNHGTVVNNVVWNANWQSGYSSPTT